MEESTRLILEKLTELFNAAGGMVQDAFPYYVQHAHLMGVAGIWMSGIAWVICLLILILGIRKESDEACIAGSIGIVTITIAMMVVMPHLISMVKVPEYHAIQDLISSLKP